MDNQIITMLWVLISICYFGIGICIMAIAIKLGGYPSRVMRVISLALWPITALVVLLEPDKDPNVNA